MSDDQEKPDKAKEAEQVTASPFPPTLLSCRGTIKYAEFRKLYEEVYNYILNGDYLILKKRTFDIPFGRQSVSMRGLSKKESTFLDKMPMYDEEGLIRPEILGQRNVARLAITLRKFHTDTYADLPEPVDDGWWEIPEVKAAITRIDSYDAVAVDLLTSVAVDIQQAKTFAFLEAAEVPESAPAP